jgi:conjugative transfer signal peptidase TraF
MRDVSIEVMWLGVGASFAVGLALVGYGAGFRWNLTDSLPRGIYRRTHEPLTRGQLVAFCLPPHIAEFGTDRGYVAKVPAWAGECPDGSQALLKPIVAVGGDVVDATKDGVSINGTPMPNSATQAKDTHGRSLPHPRWELMRRYHVPHGYLYVMSTYHERSWDSRYFGVISEESVIATAQPVWVWK